jgi:hypothetical protein
MDQNNTTPNHNHKAPTYGWLRWLLASSIGGMTSLGTSYGTTYYLVNYIIQPPPNSFETAVTSVGLLLLTMLAGGMLGGLVHWLIVGRPIPLRLWIVKWAASCVVGLVVGSIVLVMFPALDNMLTLVQTRIGPYAEVLVIGATCGIVIAWILGDTRPARSRLSRTHNANNESNR